ncbi:GNAT family N-acetyltransferase [Kitasatospora sp. DSM 101779]|uniref:GNAT family N-acetyltransferase n=1 Tax=Kitasatospora sp. DSM 101779 TaxID=2853165 RepID=UPI0021DA2921|nr:GNAT family N-acetyltransferase [Kitasatospora sp. DSM 101779]MCU7824036.1 GNAT family N-acetyltransferase [Kitasatospora sp. DSM 101779]
MTSAITLRDGGPADAPAVAALHADSLRTAYAGLIPAEALGDGLPAQRREIWELRLTVDYGGPEHTPVLLIADEPGSGPVGFAYLVPEPDGRVLLDNLHVRPGRTGGGIGTRLLRAALDRAAPAALRLEVLRDNHRAVAFYEREGAVRTAERTAVLPGGHEVAEYEYGWPGPAHRS